MTCLYNHGTYPAKPNHASLHPITIHHIMLDTQFGFHASHSCETQLLLTVDDFAKAIDCSKKN